MAIEKDQEWGRPGLLPADAPVLADDRNAADVAASAAEAGQPAPIVALESGDLARTLGVRPPIDRDAPKQLLPVDALTVDLDDGSRHWAVAHVTAGSLVWASEWAAVMNAAFVGQLNVAPKAHPGDGRLDVVELGLGFGDRIKARRRMPMGTHVPHPDISIRRRSAGVIELSRPRRIFVDGRSVGRSSTLTFELVPSALIVAV